MENKTCKMCGKKYSYCPNCERDRFKPRWMILFHDENCQKIFDTLQRHSQGLLSTKDAAKELKKCDLSSADNSTETIKKKIADILSSVKPIAPKYTVTKGQEKHSE